MQRDVSRRSRRARLLKSFSRRVSESVALRHDITCRPNTCRSIAIFGPSVGHSPTSYACLQASDPNVCLQSIPASHYCQASAQDQLHDASCASFLISCAMFYLLHEAIGGWPRDLFSKTHNIIMPDAINAYASENPIR